MKTILIALLVTGCTPAAASPDYVERHDAPQFDQPASIPTTAHATRGEHLQLTPTPAPEPAPDWPCAEWFQLSLAAGFTVDYWPQMGVIMYRESRCQPNAHNTADPITGSRGLMQVNGFWCRKSTWYPHPAGYLGTLNVLTSCDDLFDPLTNLQAARAIVQYDLDKGRCPWTQWSTRQGQC
jgi:hypothetical protein